MTLDQKVRVHLDDSEESLALIAALEERRIPYSVIMGDPAEGLLPALEYPNIIIGGYKNIGIYVISDLPKFPRTA